MKKISYDELKEMMETRQNLIIVDLLSPASFKRARLPGAINIPAENLSKVVEEKIPDKESSELVLYCSQFA